MKPKTKVTQHPGAILRNQFMARHGLSACALAVRLSVPAPRVNDIVRQRRGVSPDTALRLARFFGTTAHYWMELQAAHDLGLAVAAAGEQISRDVRPVGELGADPCAT